MDAQAIRQLVADDPRLDHAYSPEVRRVVGRYTRRRRDEGARWSDIQREVGVSSTSARTWMVALEAGGFQQVVIVDPPDERANQLVITSPSGFALSGCSLDEAVVLMQRLR